MKLYGKQSLSTMLKIVLLMMMAVITVLFFYIGYSIVLSAAAHNFALQSLLLLAFFILGSLASEHILYRFMRITNTLIASDPFTTDNVKSLRFIARDCFIVSLCYLVNFIVNPAYGKVQIISVDGKGVHTDVEYLIFLFAGCFILILSKVFEQAVVYKEENDLTV